MKWTQFLIPTLKETPADAVVPSHRLMLRAGLMRQIAAGAYAYLPLGYRTLRKIEAIVREEMNRAGGVELHMPAMQPIELWQETRRDEAMGETLVRSGGQALSPQHRARPDARRGGHRHRPSVGEQLQAAASHAVSDSNQVSR
jgi:prolyl-tRNA synthetase